MEADFSGWATKSGLKCSDGRTITPNAFQHQDKMQVPLVWQHDHSEATNVLGHAVLEAREEGVYCYGFFNDSPQGQHAKGLVQHKDVNMLSIWANSLIERSKNVLHGVIREVSLVLSGANPGAVIDNISIAHSDGGTEDLDDEAIIYTGLEIELMHSDDSGKNNSNEDNASDIKHDDTTSTTDKTGGSGDTTVADVYASMTEEQQEVLHFMIGQAIDSLSQSGIDGKNDKTDSNNDKADDGDTKGTGEMKHNVFEKDNEDKTEKAVLSHAQIQEIVSDATKGAGRSLKDAVTDYALAHGIEDIDVLFPEARSLSDVPEFLSRRVEWVQKVIGGARKSPFSRIKTISADLTFEEARAKGYVKGNLKKEEFFPVAKRITTPTTIYKKQKLDRDDVVDITDFDVVVWLKSEMRLMLDEEIARAILVGDGRDPASEDKISETNLRPIYNDNELYTSIINVNLGDTNSSVSEVVDEVMKNRAMYKGTGLPTFFTTESMIALFMTLKDTTGRRIYKNLDEVAAELRVSEIVAVEVMEEYPNVVGIMVNMTDYVIGADAGGAVSLFDDFDIDYNQYKYLIETRISGALVKLKAAIVVMKTAGTNVLVSPTEPTFDPETGALTIVNQTGVVYKHGTTVINAAGSPYSVPAGTTWVIDATPASGYYFETSDNDQWSFEADA